MSAQQKKMFGNILAISFVLMIIFIIAFISTLSYTPPQIPLKSELGSKFNWGDIFKVNSINEYRYEIVDIEKGEIEKSEFFYDIDLIDGNFQIKIFPYEGISKKEVDARITFDHILYNCVNKQYEGKTETCEYVFLDSDVNKGMFGTPLQMKKNINFEIVEMTSSIYREQIYESIKLVSTDKKTTVWIIESVPLPVRMEYKDGDIISIANLKNYN